VTAASVRLSERQIQELIELLRCEECLWNLRSDGNSNADKQKAALRRISNKWAAFRSVSIFTRIIGIGISLCIASDYHNKHIRHADCLMAVRYFCVAN
jgi:hypothetical protein